MTWEQLDLSAKTWTIPARLTKNGDPHRLYLHPLAVEILEGRSAASGRNGLVFPSPVAGRPIDTLSDIKERLATLTSLRDWRWHDFRRSFATALGEAGLQEAVVDAVLNHRQSATRGGVLGTYQRARRWPEQVKAAQIWGELIAGALDRSGHR
jgi:integrase